MTIDPDVTPAASAGPTPEDGTPPSPGTLRIVVIARPVASNRHVFAAAASAGLVDRVLTDSG